MSEPKWITLAQVLYIHDGVIEIAGGAFGVRDTGLLESALARPLNLFAYGECDLCMLAASYAEGIARNHPFVDGNKRTAFFCASDFLEQNGLDLAAARGLEHAEMMESLAQGLLDRDAAAAHFRAHCQPVG